MIEPVARRLLGEATSRTKRELRYGRKGSLSVDLDRGTWYDHEAGAGGGVLALVERETGLGGRDAIAWIEAELGESVARSRPVTQAKAPNPARSETSRCGLSAYWRSLWGRTLAITATDPAGRYLTARGCALPHRDGDLRWLPRHRHPSGWIGLALVALVTDAMTCEPISLHRTWIDPDRPGHKAPIDKPRLLIAHHSPAGGVVRLWPDAEVTLGLAIAEGIESALALARGFGIAWAALSAGNLANLPVFDGIEALTIAADHDRPNPKTGRRAGEDAAWRLAERWAAEGREVRLWRSPIEGEDIADWGAAVAE